MNKLDRWVVAVLAILLGCVLVKSVLEIASTLLLPGLLAAGIYGGIRVWQLGLFTKAAPKAVTKDEVY